MSLILLIAKYDVVYNVDVTYSFDVTVFECCPKKFVVDEQQSILYKLFFLMPNDL